MVAAVAYYEAWQLRDRAMLAVYYGCGLRSNEGVQLDAGDINLDRGTIHVRQGKGYKERLVPVSGQGCGYLQEYLYDGRPVLLYEKTDAFFLNQTGKRLSGQSMLLRLKILIQMTGNVELQTKDIHLHTLRHSIATHLLQNGMKLEKISNGEEGITGAGSGTKNTEQDLCDPGRKGNAGQRPGRNVRGRNQSVQSKCEKKYR